jgi:hypothetical protein
VKKRRKVAIDGGVNLMVRCQIYALLEREALRIVLLGGMEEGE